MVFPLCRLDAISMRLLSRWYKPAVVAIDKCMQTTFVHNAFGLAVSMWLPHFLARPAGKRWRMEVEMAAFLNSAGLATI